VTISGANFGATQGTSTVKFNGTTATPTSWSATSIVAPVPAGATTGNVVVTVGGVASNGASFTVQSDTTAPVVTITAPANNATVSGTMTLTATATDPDSPVSFVQFRVDGANVGAQLTTAPYSLSLDTTTLSNATHSITATAQDPSGNVGTSASVTITVSNASAGVPTLIYSTAAPLAILSGSSWNGPGSCTTSAHCYRIPLDPNAITAGSTLLMMLGYNSSGSNQVISVTDDKSDTWLLDATSPVNNNKTMGMYRASNVAAGVSYINVQLTGGTDNGYWQAFVAELFNVGSLDGSSCSTGSSTTISAGSFTPTQSGDLIFQAKYSANTLSSSPPYGLPVQTTSFTPGLQPNITWSLASQLLGDGAADQYGVYNSTVAVNPTFTQAASNSYVSCAVALRAASAGAAPTAIPRVVHQEHDAMPKNAPNPWHVGLVVDVPNSAVYLSYVGNDSISSVSSVPAPNVGWTPSGPDFNGLNGHNHLNYYCAQWTTPPGVVTLSINRSASSNDSINMIYVVQNGTCNLDVDSGGQAGQATSAASVLTTCSGVSHQPKRMTSSWLTEGRVIARPRA
jgi:Bacterial Ig domain/IPT/TIG domain